MSDERDRTGKRPPHVSGVPVALDDDVTPPPSAPPVESHAPLEEQVPELRASVAHLSAGLERVWDSRNATGEIARMQIALDALVKNSAQSDALLREFLMPATKQILTRLDAVERAVNTESGRQGRFFEHDWPRVMAGIDKLDRRTDIIERQLDRQERNADAAQKRAEEKHDSLLERVERLEKSRDIQASRTRSLEDFNLTLKAKVAIISSGLSVLVAIAVWAFEHMT